MTPAWITIILTVLSFSGGHFMYVRIELEKMKLRIKYMESFIDELRQHIPDMHEKINQVSQHLTEVKTKIEFLAKS